MSASNPSPARQPSTPPQPGPAAPPAHILVVDDDAELRQLNASALENSGFEVTIVNDPAARAALDAECYDLLITDHSLPKLTGIELLNELHVARKALPAILVTEAQHQTELHRYPWLQISATLLKPHAAPDLLRIVKRVLRSSGDNSRPNSEGAVS